MAGGAWPIPKAYRDRVSNRKIQLDRYSRIVYDGEEGVCGLSFTRLLTIQSFVAISQSVFLLKCVSTDSRYKIIDKTKATLIGGLLLLRYSPPEETTKSPRIRWAFIRGLDILGIKDYGLVDVSLSENKWDRMCSITATVHPFPKTLYLWFGEREAVYPCGTV